MACSISQMSQRLLGISPIFLQQSLINFEIYFLFDKITQILIGLVTWTFLATDLPLQRAVHSVEQRGLSSVRVFSCFFKQGNFQIPLRLDFRLRCSGILKMLYPTFTPLGAVTHPITENPFSESKLSMISTSKREALPVCLSVCKYVTLFAKEKRESQPNWALGIKRPKATQIPRQENSFSIFDQCAGTSRVQLHRRSLHSVCLTPN